MASLPRQWDHRDALKVWEGNCESEWTAEVKNRRNIKAKEALGRVADYYRKDRLLESVHLYEHPTLEKTSEDGKGEIKSSTLLGRDQI